MEPRREGWTFRLNNNEMGLVVTGVDGDWNDCHYVEPNDPYVDDNGDPILDEETGEPTYRINEFGKWWDSEVYGDNYLTLALKGENSYEALDADATTLNKLSVVNVDGTPLDENDYVIEVAKNGNGEPYEKVFNIRLNKTGRFGVKYTESATSSSVFTFSRIFSHLSICAFVRSSLSLFARCENIPCRL